VFLIPLAIYKTKAIPYFIALAQHSLIGDYITGEGTKILWPITSAWYGYGIPILSPTNIILEWSSFMIAIAVMLKTKDLQKLLKGQLSHLSLSIPILTVLLPSFLHFPLSVPLELLIPHFTYLILFVLSILAVFKSLQTKYFQNRTNKPHRTNDL